MRKFDFMEVSFLLVMVLASTVLTQPAKASLPLQNCASWYWIDGTEINSIASGDVDGDGAIETVTGGFYDDGTRHVAQLCVWG